MELRNKRCIQILKLLLENKETITGDRLAFSIGVSSRTIRNDMKELNSLLEGWGAEAVAEIGQGYCLKVRDEETFQKFLNQIEQKKIFKILFHQNQRTGFGILYQNCFYQQWNIKKS